MDNWIKSIDQLPPLHQPVLATIEQHGKLEVLPCWRIDDKYFVMDQNLNAARYTFSIVKAWQPFPEPYREYVGAETVEEN
jgi:hypothetical protein